jgi:hypothetical protein
MKTITVKCHFSGKYLVPEEHVDLPLNEPLVARIKIKKAQRKQRCKKVILGLLRGQVWESPDCWQKMMLVPDPDCPLK